MQPPAEANYPNRDGCTASPDGPDRQRRIALIGASVRAAAESARLADFTVVGFDRFGDQDTLAACHQFVLLDAPTKRRTPIGLGKTIGPSHDPNQEIWDKVAAITEAMPLLAVGGLTENLQSRLEGIPRFWAVPDQRDALAMVRDLAFLREVSVGTPIQLPPSYPANRGMDLQSNSNDRSRWLRKDVTHSGGLGTRWMIDHVQPASESLGEIMQQWVPGRLFGATLLSNGAEVVLLGICRSRFTRKGCFPFVYCGSIGPVDAEAMVVKALEEFSRRLVSASGLRGLFNLDFVFNPPQSLWLLEVNPRWSGSSELIERHMRSRLPKLSLLSLAVDALDGRPMQHDWQEVLKPQPDDLLFDKRIIFARRDVPFFPETASTLLQPNESLHDLPASGHLVRQGEPVCTVIRRGPRRLRGGTNTKGSMPQHRALIEMLSGKRKYESFNRA